MTNGMDSAHAKKRSAFMYHVVKIHGMIHCEGTEVKAQPRWVYVAISQTYPPTTYTLHRKCQWTNTGAVSWQGKVKDSALAKRQPRIHDRSLHKLCHMSDEHVIAPYDIQAVN